jgi:hypothetical protein
MKAVIALSGLAGFILFGPNLWHLHRVEHRHVIRIDSDAVTDVAVRAQSQCRFEAERSLTVPAGVNELLHVTAKSGSLEVVGVPGLDEVRASARACASHEEFLEELRLTSRREGSNLYVETSYPDLSGWMGGGQRYARLDLRLEVPEGIAADIRDSSGEMTVSNLGDAVIDDSSGEIEAHGIQGDIRIHDSSGEITLWDVTGSVEIDDGSGEINLSTVGGTVTIDDGSGEIDVRDVDGTVRVVRDGSGSIEVNGVGGDFIVERDGSGSIEFRNVTGQVDVPRKRR